MRVVLAEDHALLRDGLIRLLEANGFDVLEAVDNGPMLRRALLDHRPDVAIVDVRMPPTFTDDGLKAAVAARVHQPGLAVLVLSQYVEDSYAADLLADGRGGVGYLLKDRVQDLAAFRAALDTLADGGTVLDPDVVAQLLARRRPGDPLGSLTPREREVLELVAAGRSNAAISEALVISGGAVEKHVTNVFTKLDLPPSGADHRRVLAALRYLRATGG